MVKLRVLVALLLNNDRQHKSVINVVPITKCLFKNSELRDARFLSDIQKHERVACLFPGDFYISLSNCIIDIHML